MSSPIFRRRTVALALIVIGTTITWRIAGAQVGVIEPAAAKAVNVCHKTATAATGAYFVATYKS
jgi:hypothetical protein